jgi:hypothetical protein
MIGTPLCREMLARVHSRERFSTRTFSRPALKAMIEGCSDNPPDPVGLSGGEGLAMEVREPSASAVAGAMAVAAIRKSRMTGLSPRKIDK